MARWYPMLWVHLADDAVIHVYGKRYVGWGIDDMGVYGLSRNQEQWETPAFEKTFPHK